MWFRSRDDLFIYYFLFINFAHKVVMRQGPLEILLDFYSKTKVPSFSIQMIKDYERRNYIQAETIYNKLNNEKVLRYKIVHYNHWCS
jgi:hypothetical protein